MSTNVYNDILINNGAADCSPTKPQTTVIKPVKREQGVIKVAAYCRVSTDMELQQNSLDTQIEAYTRIINEHPGWELSGIYADKGITGTMVRRRTEFLRMIEDAKAGKINYILAKSISRFSRNTVDAIEYIRLLKNLGVSVYFEKEHLDTGSTASELILTILAAAAQEEILTISTNLKMGRRMRAEAGMAAWTPTYGYRLKKTHTGNKYEDKEAERWIIHEKEAKVVRRIFQEFIEGWSTTEISQHLNDDGVPTARGYGKWASMTLSRIINNEKYLGDVLAQKYYIKDPIQHIMVRNKGIITQYYIKDHHPAIIDRQTGETVKKIAALRDNHNGTTQYPFYGLLKCPICGVDMVRVPVYLHNRYYVWTCGGRTQQQELTRAERTQCPPYAISEKSILEAVCTAAELAGKDIQREQPHDGKATEGTGQDGNDSHKNRSRGRGNLVGSWKYEVLSYKKLIAAVSSMTVPTWDQIKVTWAEGEPTTVQLKRDSAKVPNPVADTNVEEKLIAKAIDDIQNAIIEDGELVPKVYGVGSKRFKGGKLPENQSEPIERPDSLSTELCGRIDNGEASGEG